MKVNQPNIILRVGHRGFLFKEVTHFSCIHCDKKYPLDTKDKLYLFNAHGWVICEKDWKYFK